MSRPKRIILILITGFLAILFSLWTTSEKPLPKVATLLPRNNESLEFLQNIDSAVSSVCISGRLAIEESHHELALQQLQTRMQYLEQAIADNEYPESIPAMQKMLNTIYRRIYLVEENFEPMISVIQDVEVRTNGGDIRVHRQHIDALELNPPGTPDEETLEFFTADGDCYITNPATNQSYPIRSQARPGWRSFEPTTFGRGLSTLLDEDWTRTLAEIQDPDWTHQIKDSEGKIIARMKLHPDMGNVWSKVEMFHPVSGNLQISMEAEDFREVKSEVFVPYKVTIRTHRGDQEVVKAEYYTLNDQDGVSFDPAKLSVRSMTPPNIQRIQRRRGS